MITYRLTGAKVGLRSLSAADAEGAYFDWLQQSEVIAALSSQKWPISRSGLADYIRANTDCAGVALFGICRLADDLLVGTVRLALLDAVARVGGIGVMIGERSVRGGGLAGEALSLAIRYGFDTLNLQKICAGVASGNAASLALFRRSMQVEGVRRRQVFADGQFQDEHMFAVFRD